MCKENIHPRWGHCVYFMAELGGYRPPIKIGYTKQIARRLQDSKTYLPKNLSVLAVMLFHNKSDAEIVEKQMHSVLKNQGLHVGGEWFNDFNIATLLNGYYGEGVRRLVNSEDMWVAGIDHFRNGMDEITTTIG